MSNLVSFSFIAHHPGSGWHLAEEKEEEVVEYEMKTEEGEEQQ